MNIIKRQKINPVTVVPGDSIQLIWREPGKPGVIHAEKFITKAQTFDEAILFTDVFDGKNAIGGMWLEEKR